MTAIRRFLALALLGALALGSAACSKDKEVEAAAAELDAFTKGLVDTMRKAPNPRAGVDEGEKYLEANRSRLQAKLAAVKTVRGFQLSEQTKKKLNASFASAGSAIGSLQLEYTMQVAGDQPLRERLEKLVKDYLTLLA